MQILPFLVVVWIFAVGLYGIITEAVGTSCI